MSTLHLSIVPKTQAALTALEPSKPNAQLLADLAGLIALQEPQFLRALVRMGKEAEHQGYLRGMADCGRIRAQARAITETIPDDPARTAPPGELPSDAPAKDEPCWDEGGFTSGAGAGVKL